MKKQAYRMIRVPDHLHARLTRLADEILVAKERGQGYNDVPLAEQGERGVWVPLHGIITRALDEFESHRIRSKALHIRQSRSKSTSKRKG